MAFMSADDPFTDMTGVAIAGRALYGVTGWCALVAIAGLLDRPAPSTPDGGKRRVAGYLRTAVLPLYLLHQPILVAVAYVVVRWDAPIAVKYTVLVTVTYAVTLAAYELVRRTSVTRSLFGMRGAG